MNHTIPYLMKEHIHRQIEHKKKLDQCTCYYSTINCKQTVHNCICLLYPYLCQGSTHNCICRMTYLYHANCKVTVDKQHYCRCDRDSKTCRKNHSTNWCCTIF
jgi:hypothetical protein